MKQLGVVAALPVEAVSLVGHRAQPGSRVALPQSGWLQVAGVGAAAASQAAEALLSGGADALASWGVAAGLNPELTSGTLLLPSTVVGHEGEIFSVDPHWHDRLNQHLATSLLQSVHGRLLESHVVVADPKEKHRLFRQTAAAGMDMESAAVARVAQDADVPFVIIRALLDPLNASLPTATVRAVNAQGEWSTREFLWQLARRPTDVLALPGLARRFYLAQRTLRQVVAIAGADLMVENGIATRLNNATAK